MNNNNTHEKYIKKYVIEKDIYEQQDFMKDCPNYNFTPLTLPAVTRIIAIGDIHGDLQLAVRSFKLAKLIDDNMNWIANPLDTIVVQVGDQIDSCRPLNTSQKCSSMNIDGDLAEDILVLRFFDDMNNKAKNHGGAVISLLGNHELMNSIGNLNYVSKKNLENFEYESDSGKKYIGVQGRLNAFKPGSELSNKLACTRSSVIIIGSTMFVHAGVLPILARDIENINYDARTKLKYLNSIIRKWLLNKLDNENDKSLAKNMIYGTESPFWTRIFGSIPANQKMETSVCKNSVKSSLETYKIGYMVIGHTPQKKNNTGIINGTCYEKDDNGRLYKIDGGFSRAFDVFGNRTMIQVLEIINDRDFNIITEKMPSL